MTNLFRSWGPPKVGKDPEMERLDKKVNDLRQQVAALKKQGQQRRSRQGQSIEALETKKMTLDEILKRMELELKEKNVDEYADVLAEAFGERKIFAHRAIGLEALLCQFMHQMLAKQHQLKIMKRLGKDLQKRLQKVKVQNKSEFHSYEVLAVQCETMRLSLEAQYDDVFAAQHALLAQLHQVHAAGGTMTNYTIVKPKSLDPSSPLGKRKNKKPTLTVSSKHAVTDADLMSPKSITYLGDSSDDDQALMDHILASPREEDFQSPVQRKSDTKSARDRRRAIEQQRLASGRGNRMSTAQFGDDSFEDGDENYQNGNGDSGKRLSVRERMRALEAKVSSPTNGDGDLQERSSRRGSKSGRSYGSKSPVKNRTSIEDDEEARRRRRERRKERTSLVTN